MHEKGCFTGKEYLKICPSGSKPGILYGQAKVCNPIKDNCPSFCPIFSATGTPILAKFIVLILKPLPENEYTVQDFFSFASEISKINSNN